MKLPLYKIQILDFLLKKLNYSYSYTLKEETLRLIIKIDSNLWKGDFAKYKYDKIYSYYIDTDNCVEYNTYCFANLFPFDFNNLKYSRITSDNLDLLLYELSLFLKNLNLENITKLPPILYNAVNLDTNTSLPFILLNPEMEYDVISINVCTRS